MSSTEKLTRNATAGPTPTDGTGLVGLVRRRPLTAFLVWFFTVGQAFAFAPVIARANGIELTAQPFIIGSTLVGLLLPAVVITRVVDGPERVRELWRSSIAAWVALRWYALALGAVPLVATGLTVAIFGAPTVALTPATIASALVSGLLLQTVIALVPNNWAEEVAWMGFFQARLQGRSGSPMRAAALTAPLFALQHVALVVGNSLLVAGLLMLMLIVLAVPYRAVAAWTYNTTGSLFLVGFLHAAGNAAAAGSGFGESFLKQLYPGEDFVGITHLLAFAVIGLVVIGATRARLGRTSRPEPAASQSS